MRCVDCHATNPGRTTRAWARGLCRHCYDRHALAGDLCDYERKLRPRDEVIEDWSFLNAQGYTRRQAAERMGMTRAALDRAIARAKRDGDPRALQEKKAA